MIETAPGGAALALGSVPVFAGVPAEELACAAARGARVVYERGGRLFGELEPRETLVLVLSGRVRVSVAAGEPGEVALGEVGPGTLLGEIGLITGRLASATAIALERSEVFVLPREAVHDLMLRYPVVASAFARLLAARIAATDEALARALQCEVDVLAPLPDRRAEAERRRSLGRALVGAFRDAVLEHRTELPFFFLSGFVGALVLARIAVLLGHFTSRGFRDIYVAGLLLLVVTGASAHFVFHRRARRILCAAHGLALGFLASELSVLLSFDVFYLDMTTRDPNATYSFTSLYDRAPTRWALILVIAIAIQATFLRRFYRRAAFLIRERLLRRRR